MAQLAPSPAPSRILVTGAAGFVGGHLVPMLRAAFPDAALFTPTTDITDAEAVARMVQDAAPDACIHLAAIAAIPAARTQPDHAWQVNLHGTLALAGAILRHAPACRLVFPSSADCYGGSFRSGMALDETAALAPRNTYAATKAAAELALGALAAEGLRAIVLRPFNHTGPGQSDAFVVPAFARQVARIEAGLQPPVLNVGALDPLRDFLDVRDVTDAYVACLRTDWAPGTILNIASGTPRRIGDVLAALVAMAGITASVSTGAALLRPADIPTATGNAHAARTALGWSPRIPWNQTLADVLDDWRQRVRAPEASLL